MTPSTQPSRSSSSGNAGAVNSNSNLEAKLQTVAASFRQKRDEAHRQQQLALERLRLIQEEADALSATVTDLQSKLERLQQQSGGSAAVKQELQSLYQQVDHLTKEFNFQHQELVQKRDKLKQMKVKSCGCTKQYDTVRTNLQNAIHLRRMQLLNDKKHSHDDKDDVDSLLISDDDDQSNQENKMSGNISNINNSKKTNNNQKKQNRLKELTESLQDEINADDHYGRLYRQWPKVVVGKTETIQARHEQSQRWNVLLNRVASNYEKSNESSLHDLTNTSGSISTLDFPSSVPFHVATAMRNVETVTTRNFDLTMKNISDGTSTRTWNNVDGMSDVTMTTTLDIADPGSTNNNDPITFTNSILDHTVNYETNDQTNHDLVTTEISVAPSDLVGEQFVSETNTVNTSKTVEVRVESAQ